MRNIVVLMVLAFLVACGGGGTTVTPPPSGDTNPVGHWQAQGGGSWDVVAVGNAYVVDFTAADLIDFDMTMSGSNFTMTGSETDLSGIERIDYNITGSISGDTMTGDWELTTTNLQTQDVDVDSTPFTATRGVV